METKLNSDVGILAEHFKDNTLAPPHRDKFTLLELCSNAGFGGLEIHFLQFSQWLRQHLCDHPLCGHENRCRHENEAAKKRDQPTNHTNKRYPALKTRILVGATHQTRLAQALKPELTLPRSPIKRFLELRKFIIREQVDVIHIHHKRDLPLVVFANMLCGRHLKLVHTRHMQIGGPKKDPYHWFLYKSLDLFLVVTEQMRQQAQRFLPLRQERVRKISLGVPQPKTGPVARQDIRRAFGITPSAFVVANIARVEHQKGQHIFIDAIARLIKSPKYNIPIYGLIAGQEMDDAYATALQKRIKTEALPIHWLGHREDIPAIIAAADAVCITTQEETFGLIAVESMLAKRVAVGADSGGIREIITHEENGILYKTFDAQALMQSLAQLYQAPERRKQLAQAGYESARQRFCKQQQFGKILQALTNLLR